MGNDSGYSNYFVYIYLPELTRDIAYLKGYKNFVIYEGDKQFGFIHSWGVPDSLICKNQSIILAKLISDKISSDGINLISIEKFKKDIEDFDRDVSFFIGNQYTIFKKKYPVYEIFLQSQDIVPIFKLAEFLNRKKVKFKIFISPDPLLTFWMGRFLFFEGIIFWIYPSYTKPLYRKLSLNRIFPSSSDFFIKTNIESLTHLSLFEKKFIRFIFEIYITLINKKQLESFSFYFESLYPFIKDYMKRSRVTDNSVFYIFLLFYELIKKYRNQIKFVIKNPLAFQIKNEEKFKFYFKNQLLNCMSNGNITDRSMLIKDIQNLIFTVTYIDKKEYVFKIRNRFELRDFYWFEYIYREFKKNIKRNVNIETLTVEFQISKNNISLFNDNDKEWKMISLLNTVFQLNKRFGKNVITIAG